MAYIIDIIDIIIYMAIALEANDNWKQKLYILR